MSSVEDVAKAFCKEQHLIYSDCVALEQLITARDKEVRALALEEAAEVADGAAAQFIIEWNGASPVTIAAAIRALKDKEVSDDLP